MTTEGREDKDGMDRQDDEALWSLLGRQAPPVQPGPYFSRRVLREVALAEERRAAGWRGWLTGRGAPTTVFRRAAWWSGAFSGVCAVGLFCLSLGMRLPKTGTVPRGESVTAAMAQALPLPVGTPFAVAEVPEATATAAHDSVPVEEVEVIADLDNILQREESRLWTEDTARF